MKKSAQPTAQKSILVYKKIKSASLISLADQGALFKT